MAKDRQFDTLKDLPELAGWLTFGEAATELGISGERVRQKAQAGELTTAHRIGRRPVCIVREEEVMELSRKRQEELEAKFLAGQTRTEAQAARGH